MGPRGREEDGRDGPTGPEEVEEDLAWVRRSTSARAAARAAESTRDRLLANDHLLGIDSDQHQCS